MLIKSIFLGGCFVNLPTPRVSIQFITKHRTFFPLAPCILNTDNKKIQYSGHYIPPLQMHYPSLSPTSILRK